MYQQVTPIFEGAAAQCIKRLADNAFIPFDDANTDFVEYQRWLAEGHVPTPAEPTQTEPNAG